MGSCPSVPWVPWVGPAAADHLPGPGGQALGHRQHGSQAAVREARRFARFVSQRPLAGAPARGSGLGLGARGVVRGSSSNLDAFSFGLEREAGKPQICRQFFLYF